MPTSREKGVDNQKGKTCPDCATTRQRDCVFMGAILSVFGLFSFKRINNGQHAIYSETMMHIFRIAPSEASPRTNEP
uniref:Uncharacterized protein n=1 Tax=Candidatus Kentrum sp. FW TaxID=2126338 RepID=A0A450RTG0_9GAMM|nr:MAG: hypothetical protein BECKFW1821A_GA0114235_100196 [Candidatus Kentron sp. FW]VFJ50126.1 MAG: hypothetical protein BECKFW1821B_GA0114236_100640 [Candidatus Kentron sp. FW]